MITEHLTEKPVASHSDPIAFRPVRPIRLVSIVEATTVTGPMKPLLMFSNRMRTDSGNLRAISHSVITTIRGVRSETPPSNAFLAAAKAIGLDVDLVYERFALDPFVIGQMAAHLRQCKPDVVETHDFKSHFLMWLLRRRKELRDFRWLAFHHGYTKMSTRVRAYQQLDRISLPTADGVVTLCNPFVTQLMDRGVTRKKISVIANAVEQHESPTQGELDALRMSLGMEQRDRIILSVGRLSGEKGHSELIEAFRALAKSNNNLRLLLVGDGGEAVRLKAEARDLGDRVVFAGHRKDAWPFYHLAEIFVLPSHTEGSPLVLFEAMAAGLPIVATAVGGIPETVEDGISAVLIPPETIPALQSALADLLANPVKERSLSSAAIEQVKKFSPEAYSAKLSAIYAGLMSGR